jgi:hypothetical protein
MKHAAAMNKTINEKYLHKALELPLINRDL